jgi:hypothetical protein
MHLFCNVLHGYRVDSVPLVGRSVALPEENMPKVSTAVGASSFNTAQTLPDSDMTA